MMKRVIAGTMFAAMFATAAHAQGAPTPPPSEFVPERIEASCSDISLNIYFKPGSAELTREAERAIDANAGNWTDCALTGLETEAVSADAAGTDAALELARARTEAVISRIAEAGIPEAREEAVSDLRLVNATDTYTLPSERAVKVTFRLGSSYAS